MGAAPGCKEQERQYEEPSARRKAPLRATAHFALAKCKKALLVLAVGWVLSMFVEVSTGGCMGFYRRYGVFYRCCCSFYRCSNGSYRWLANFPWVSVKVHRHSWSSVNKVDIGIMMFFFRKPCCVPLHRTADNFSSSLKRSCRLSNLHETALSKDRSWALFSYTSGDK
jgi:hypothetical protein